MPFLRLENCKRHYKPSLMKISFTFIIRFFKYFSHLLKKMKLKNINMKSDVFFLPITRQAAMTEHGKVLYNSLLKYDESCLI